MPIEVLSYRAHILLEAPGLNSLTGRDDTKKCMQNTLVAKSGTPDAHTSGGRQNVSPRFSSLSACYSVSEQIKAVTE